MPARLFHKSADLSQVRRLVSGGGFELNSGGSESWSRWLFNKDSGLSVVGVGTPIGIQRSINIYLILAFRQVGRKRHVYLVKSSETRVKAREQNFGLRHSYRLLSIRPMKNGCTRFARVPGSGFARVDSAIDSAEAVQRHNDGLAGFGRICRGHGASVQVLDFAGIDAARSCV